MEKKRLLSEGETDVESTPKKMRSSSFEKVFDNGQRSLITEELHHTTEDDPILVLHFILEWLQIPGNEQVQQEVIQFLKDHRGTDRKNSGFIFHFQTLDDLLTARDDMREAIPGAFHYSIQSVHEMNIILAANHLPLLPIPVPMADAWFIVKTAVVATNYKADESFFLK